MLVYLEGKFYNCKYKFEYVLWIFCLLFSIIPGRIIHSDFCLYSHKFNSSHRVPNTNLNVNIVPLTGDFVILSSWHLVFPNNETYLVWLSTENTVKYSLTNNIWSEWALDIFQRFPYKPRLHAYNIELFMYRNFKTNGLIYSNFLNRFKSKGHLW